MSTDSIDDADDQDVVNFPVEFLNGLTPSGMPRHKLNVKVGAIIMLLRNLNTKRGLCNGTRLIVEKLCPNLIIAKALTGTAAGQLVFIPRIDLAPSNIELPFVLRLSGHIQPGRHYHFGRRELRRLVFRLRLFFRNAGLGCGELC